MSLVDGTLSGNLMLSPGLLVDMKEKLVVQVATRTAVAVAASLAVLLTACGQPPVGMANDPVATPAPGAVPTPAEVAAPPPEATPAGQAAESAYPTPSPSATSAAPTPAPATTPTPGASTKPAQKAGPAILSQGNQSDRVKELQARLAQAGWFSGKATGYYGPETQTAVSGFQGKRGLPVTGAVDQATWDRLAGMTRTPTADELSGKPKAATTPGASGQRKAQGLDSRCMTGRVVCISKKSNKLWWMNDGVVISSVDVRFGTDEYPTREGTFSVGWKSRDHVSTLYHTPMPYALFFSGGQAVHYSPDFAANGYQGGSHGCVNVRDKGAMQAMFNQVREGDKVIVYS